MPKRPDSVQALLASLPADRRRALEAVREVIRAHAGPDLEEGFAYGMLAFCIPHRVYPGGYHCNPAQPLPYAALAAQKNHLSLHLMHLYGDAEQEAVLRAEWARTGKKLDLGKCCIRFRALEDLPLEVLAAAVRRMPARAYLERYRSQIDPRTGKAKSQRPSTTKAKTSAGSASRTAAPKAQQRRRK